MTWLISQALMRAYENSRFSQEQAAESLGDTCLDGGQSAPSRGSHTPQAYCAPDKMTAFSRLSRFGMTFAPLTDDSGEGVAMWCRGVSLARILPPVDLVQVSTGGSLDSGEKWRGLLAKCSPVTFSWKTAQCSLLEDSGESLETWPDSGSTRSGDAYLRPPLVPLTEEIGSGLLPTPSGTTNHGKNHVVGRLDEWGGASNVWRGTEIGKMRCPSFEEWMMGWPVSWTELTPYETAKFLEWQQQHSPACASEQDGNV